MSSTRLQKGHWKSENSWMITGAFAAPRKGADGGTGTTSAFFSGNGAVFPPSMVFS